MTTFQRLIFQARRPMPFDSTLGCRRLLVRSRFPVFLLSRWIAVPSTLRFQTLLWNSRSGTTRFGFLQTGRRFVEPGRTRIIRGASQGILGAYRVSVGVDEIGRVRLVLRRWDLNVLRPVLGAGKHERIAGAGASLEVYGRVYLAGRVDSTDHGPAIQLARARRGAANHERGARLGFNVEYDFRRGPCSRRGGGCSRGAVISGVRGWRCIRA